MDSYINKVQTINQFFQGPIIDLNPIQKYSTTFNFSLFQDMKDVFNSKQKFRESIVASVSPRIAQIYSIKCQKCAAVLTAQKKTDITHFWTNLLIPQQGNRFLIQKFRMKLLVKLRKEQQLVPQEIFIVKNLYQLMLQNTIKKDLQKEQLKNQNEPNLLKKILISLKKMMGIGRRESVLDVKGKKEKRKAYLMNVDIKEIVKESLTLIQSRPLKQKLQAILTQKKDKNWFGPNLYKFFQNSNLSNLEIREIYKALQMVNLQELSLNTTHHMMKRTLKKILSNINFLIKEFPKPVDLNIIFDLPVFMLDSPKNQFLEERQQEEMEQIDQENVSLNNDDHLFEFLCLDEQ